MSVAELYVGPSGDDDAVEPAYHVRLPVFDGPMELLLHLIRKNEVEIYDIPIAEITRQYLEILELMEELNLGLAGDFLVMAASLIHIKSKMLLPPPHEDGTEDEPSEDPRAELVARLLEYTQYKEAAQQLHQQEELRSATFVRPDPAQSSNGHNASTEIIEVDLFELISAFRDVLERVRQRADLVYERETISIEQMIERLSRRLAPAEECKFVELFDDASDRATVIVTFLAVLEMVRLRLLRIYQQKLFGTIYVIRLPEESHVR
ncbi:MAG TPA: segregation/condensation protein A [Vicinamibacteria bacterium]|nr:segregation/condensation protein A [Vicinamibacteria bacterium]